MFDSPVWWIVAAVVVLAVILAVALLRHEEVLEATGVTRRRRPHRDEFRPDGADEEPVPLKRAAVVVNPTKFADAGAMDMVRARITATCRAEGWGEPLWYETTVADPGPGQARQAVADGAAVVCSLGGDGTTRSVASALVGGETPLGLLPGGTGNLLARNLDLPVDSVDKALVVALTGQNVRIDVGRMTIEPTTHQTSSQTGTSDQAVEQIFLVMAGIGLDAAIMADAADDLKARVGPAAYVVSGFRNWLGPQFRVRMKVDGEGEFSRRTRTVIVGNCGRLFGGVILMPGARVDDGRLDTVVLSPRGVVGWTAVAGHVFTRQRRGHPLIDRHSGREIHIATDRPEEVQLDGDPVGPARSMTARVDPLALIVRVGTTPAPTPLPTPAQAQTRANRPSPQ